jgi:hypothetical protein
MSTTSTLPDHRMRNTNWALKRAFLFFFCSARFLYRELLTQCTLQTGRLSLPQFLPLRSSLELPTSFHPFALTALMITGYRPGCGLKLSPRKANSVGRFKGNGSCTKAGERHITKDSTAEEKIKAHSQSVTQKVTTPFRLRLRGALLGRSPAAAAAPFSAPAGFGTSSSSSPTSCSSSSPSSTSSSRLASSH